MVQEFSEESLLKTVDEPLDNARADFVADKNVLESYDEFLHAVESFYVHLVGVNEIGGNCRVREQAWELIEKEFAKEGGYAVARDESMHGTSGGLRYVLDRMTSHLKRSRREARMKYLFLSQVDPLDSDEKVAFARSFIARFKDYLPEEMLHEPPERYANHLLLLLGAFLDFRKTVGSMVRTF